MLLANLGLSQASGQKQFDINSQTVFKDSEGNRVGFETFIEWTSGSGYEMEPIFNEDGSLKEIVINSISINSEVKTSEFSATPELVERTPPRFEAFDLQNQFVSLDNYKDKVVVIKFWFAACPPCIKEIPKLNNVFKQYENNPDVIFLAPSLDDVATINSSQQRNPFYYNIIPRAQDLAQQYNVLGYPTHVVINKSGTVEAVFQGVNHRIDELLVNAIESGLNRRINNNSNRLASASPADDVVMLNPNSVIVDEQGKIVPFDQFVQMMELAHYELLNKTDAAGNKVIMMKEVVRN